MSDDVFPVWYHFALGVARSCDVLVLISSIIVHREEMVLSLENQFLRVP